MSEKCHHEWIADDTQLCEPRAFMCTQCGERCPGCNVCGGPTNSSLLACQRCLDREAQVLTDIEDALSHWEPSSRSAVKPTRYDRDTIHRSSSRETPAPVDESPADIEAVLLDWVALWTEVSRDPQNLGPADYLRGHLLYAAHNAERAAWDDYRDEMRQLRHRARRMAGLLPQRQAGLCIYCGGTVVRDWADEKWQPRRKGLSDEFRCTDCRTQWEDRERWQFANRNTILALPLTHPERLVTREDARMIFPAVPPATWRKWVQRDAERGEALLRYAEYCQGGRFGPPPKPEKMPTQGFNHRGLALYRLGDLTAHVEAWLSDARVNRRAG